MNFQQIQSILFLRILLKYTFAWNKYFVELVISRLRSRTESSEGKICIIRKEDSPSKGAQPLRRMTHPKDSVQKDDHKKYASHEVPHLQSVFNTLHGSN